MTVKPAPTARIRSKGRPRSAEADAAILEATRDLLNEHGWAGLSIGAVAERAGVAKTTVYRRWASKGDLAVDAAADIFGSLTLPDSGDLQADAETLVRKVADLLGDPKGQPVLLSLAAAVAQKPRLRGRIRTSIVDQHRALVVTAKERAVARGETASDADPELVFDIITGTLINRLLIIGQPIDDAYIHRLVSLVLIGLRGGEPTPPARSAGPDQS